MHRILFLSALAVAAAATTFGTLKLVQSLSAPAGMVWIPGGEFTMGTDSDLGKPDEKPAHRVRVDGPHPARLRNEAPAQPEEGRPSV